MPTERVTERAKQEEDFVKSYYIKNTKSAIKKEGGLFYPNKDDAVHIDDAFGTLDDEFDDKEEIVDKTVFNDQVKFAFGVLYGTLVKNKDLMPKSPEVYNKITKLAGNKTFMKALKKYSNDFFDSAVKKGSNKEEKVALRKLQSGFDTNLEIATNTSKALTKNPEKQKKYFKDQSGFLATKLNEAAKWEKNEETLDTINTKKSEFFNIQKKLFGYNADLTQDEIDLTKLHPEAFENTSNIFFRKLKEAYPNNKNEIKKMQENFNKNIENIKEDKNLAKFSGVETKTFETLNTSFSEIVDKGPDIENLSKEQQSVFKALREGMIHSGTSFNAKDASKAFALVDKFLNGELSEKEIYKKRKEIATALNELKKIFKSASEVQGSETGTSEIEYKKLNKVINTLQAGNEADIKKIDKDNLFDAVDPALQNLLKSETGEKSQQIKKEERKKVFDGVFGALTIALSVFSIVAATVTPVADAIKGLFSSTELKEVTETVTTEIETPIDELINIGGEIVPPPTITETFTTVTEVPILDPLKVGAVTGAGVVGGTALGGFAGSKLSSAFTTNSDISKEGEAMQNANNKMLGYINNPSLLQNTSTAVYVN